MRPLVVLVAFVLLLGPARAGEEQAAAAASAKPLLTAQLGHTRPLTSVRLSPDGRHVLTGSRDDTACLWERETGREVRRYHGHTNWVYSAVFSSDGQHVLTASRDGTARLWETETGREVRCYHGHSDAVRSAVFSLDERHVLTAGDDSTARLWETESGREVRRFQGHSDEVRSAVFSPDERQVLTAGKDSTARLWQTETAREVQRFEGHSKAVSSAAFSPGGRHVLTTSWDATARLWETESGREVRRYEGHTDGVISGTFSPDGGYVLTAGNDGTARLWETDSGQEVCQYRGHSDSVMSAVFSPDGRHVLTAGWFDRTARLWETESGREVCRYQGHSDSVFSAVFSPDRLHVLTAGWFDRTARLWGTERGGEVRRHEGHSDEILSVTFSADGRHLLTASKDGSARLWDTETGREVRRYEGHPLPVFSAVFSPRGHHVVTASWDGTARLWNAETGEEVRRYEGHNGQKVYSAAFSPDGRRVVTASDDKTVCLWDRETGRELTRIDGHTDFVYSAVFSPDGRHVLTASGDGTARLWDTETGREVRRYEERSRPVMAATFSPDGCHVLTASWDGMARLVEAETGREVCRYVGHSSKIMSATFSSDGRFVLTASEDSTTRVWDAETGRELCRLISFRDGTWAVVDPQGRYDASRAGEVEGLHWTAGKETISLAQLKDRYYDPGLLAKHMGLSKEPLREVATFDEVELFPRVDVTPPDADDARVRIALENRGGGIGRVVVLINGKEVAADARGGKVQPGQAAASLALDVAEDPRVRPGETNTIQVFAYNAEGYLRSRGPLIEWDAPGEREVEPPHLWAIVCGVSDYRTDAIDLRYAAKDAGAFAGALRLAAAGLLGDERVHLTLLATTAVEGTVRPTRTNLEQAFTAAREAGPDDLLVVYLAGHGVNVGGQDGDYHYLLAEAASGDLSDPAVRRATSVSSDELTAWINEIPATKRQVLILDTCAAGQLIENLTETRAVPGSQIRALDRMKDRTGMFVLAGCAADRVSYEATRYGQGLLTYSLLLGMRGGALRDDEFVDVQRLFDFAADHVPIMARHIGGIQRPVIAQPRGGASFDLGRLPVAVREQIPLPPVKPVFVRTSFQDDRTRRDTLKLSAALDAALREVAGRGGKAPLIFVDAREMPDAYEITGGYVVDGDAVTVTALLWTGEEQRAELTIEGRKDDVPALAARIVETVQQQYRDR